ncbi:gamma-glutamyltransferase [Falsirhodobacter xinxiangensis]|uniref:gamma-glutamyltransferase n=1 Tax=Falsirhodobacter xinxiangensis TaxID=2530049 RepID=UPI0010AA8A57|nr:gamma-glutamyltransferase [Rhodobacter xinxiangensis]
MVADALLRASVSVCGPAVVTAAHPAVAAAAAGALAAGGNAFDAAVAGCLMETVALPIKCGLAGDLVALFRPAGGQITALISVGAGAAALTAAALTPTGPASVGVPGAPHGYATLAGMGRLPLGDLARPAICAARAGIAWRGVDLAYVRAGAALLARYSPDNPYAPNGVLPKVGDIRKLPGLGALVEAFVAQREALFTGDLGVSIAERVQRLGGFLRPEDFAQTPARILAPHQNGSLVTTPAPTHGPALAQAFAQGGPPTPALVREVLADAKARGRRAADGGTSVFGCADAEGNVVVVLHSNSFPQMASGVVMPDGLILNNRAGRGFDRDAPAGSVAAPGPGKTPPTTLHAWAQRQDGRLIFGATPGGVNQLPWNLQVLTRLAAGDTLVDAVCAPRWAMDAKGAVTVEPGAPSNEGTAIAPYALRSVAQLLCVAEDGGLHHAAADPRTGAVAVAVY